MLLNRNTNCCLIRWCGPPKRGHFRGKLAYCWTMLQITVVLHYPAVEGGISAVVEPLAVVCDVKGVVYSSSSLLSYPMTCDQGRMD